MYINSLSGGSVYASRIYDTAVQFVSPDVSTICTSAASMGAILM